MMFLFHLLGSLIPSALAAVSDLPGPIMVPSTAGATGCLTGVACLMGGAAGLGLYIASTIFSGARMVFIAFGFLMFLYYAVRLILESSDESTIAEVKTAYTYGITGAMAVGVVDLIVASVGQGGGNSAQLINNTAVSSIMTNLGLYFRFLVASAVAGLIVFEGIKLILLQGNESEFDAQRKRFVQSLIGVTVIMMASILVNAFAPPGYGNGDPLTLVTQIVGIVNFLLTIGGGLCLVAFIVAGFFLVISVNESLKDRAKKLMLGTAVTVIILLMCSTIIHFIVDIGTGI